MPNSTTFLDEEIGSEKGPRDPSDLASELASELRDKPSSESRPAGRKRAGAHPRGCKCGNCKWSRPGASNPETKTAEPTPEQKAAADFHLDPDILVPAVYGLGKRATDHYKVTPYTKDEARDVSKALSYCIEFLIKLWGMNPAYAPFAFLLILLIFQIGGRVVEYRIINEEPEPEPKTPPVALTIQ